jgi:hypothetical protein
MTGEESSQFVVYLRQNNHLTKTAGNGELAGSGDHAKGPLHDKLWQHTSLPDSEFADEAARFFGLERVTLEDLLSVEPFSQRFLREMMIFPYRLADRGGARSSASERHDREEQLLSYPHHHQTGKWPPDLVGGGDRPGGRRAGSVSRAVMAGCGGNDDRSCSKACGWMR